MSSPNDSERLHGVERLAHGVMLIWGWAPVAMFMAYFACVLGFCWFIQAEPEPEPEPQDQGGETP